MLIQCRISGQKRIEVEEGGNGRLYFYCLVEMAQKMPSRTDFLAFGIASLQVCLWTQCVQTHCIPQDPHAQVYSNILAVLQNVPGAFLSAS